MLSVISMLLCVSRFLIRCGQHVDDVHDRDVILSVIRSSSCNTNCKVSGYGITFPNVGGQEKVIRHAYKRAYLDPNKTVYLETHGTGTPVGDSIEVRAVSRAMDDTQSPERPLLVGAGIGGGCGLLAGLTTMCAVLMADGPKLGAKSIFAETY
ncbi:hypothetical protein BGW36DRAFT_375638 [Talaromyces proteolyticus]|uniref:Ketosynthase family 3 (KS3) domain-containing protein n=1 Tax=Talaromyces proteolyticus TaxID=1131652 RepID=A0AAD4KX71_9EURO|nr:uncharacterized protein BGW36DRAFT_375638 [Talaromyces proteolyticus]KAH8701133.1 hypothetical protein BGW36DRAFT_375638 [Talaromyces proteolyticus]